MDLSEERERLVVTVVKLLVAALPAFVLVYQTNQQFRWAVNERCADALYRLRFRRWRLQVWNRLSPLQRELYEQRHGPLA